MHLIRALDNGFFFVVVVVVVFYIICNTNLHLTPICYFGLLRLNIYTFTANTLIA